MTSNSTYQISDELLSKKEVFEALEKVKKSPLNVRHTPCIKVADSFGLAIFRNEIKCNLFLKLESMQNTNSFKIRGVANQFESHGLRYSQNENDKTFVTMSAGNYGRSFAYASKEFGMTGNTVLMPETAPDSRERIIKEFNVNVKKLPSPKLMDGIRQYEKNGSCFLHPFDDRHLIAGYCSLGHEILQDVPDVDIVVVCCGGGGLLAGLATSLAYLAHHKVRVFGVEPETACGMYKSVKEGRPVLCPEATSIASGLAPPFAGENAYRHVKEFVESILLVSEDELRSAVSLAFDTGLVVEAAGAAALAAFFSGKLQQQIKEDLFQKNIVLVITGSNVTSEEISKMKNN